MSSTSSATASIHLKSIGMQMTSMATSFEHMFVSVLSRLHMNNPPIVKKGSYFHQWSSLVCSSDWGWRDYYYCGIDLHRVCRSSVLTDWTYSLKPVIFHHQEWFGFASSLWDLWIFSLYLNVFPSVSRLIGSGWSQSQPDKFMSGTATPSWL